MALRHWITTLAVVALTAAPAIAQDNNQRRQRDNRGQSQQPRQEQPQAQSAPQARQRERAVPRNSDAPRADVQRGQDTQRREDVQRRDNQGRRDTQARPQYDNRGYADRNRGNNGNYGRPQNDGRRYDGNYGGGYAAPRRYGYAPRIIRPTIIQVLPYRPYSYRPSFRIGVYYGTDGYYPYGYTPDGYFNPIPGRYYGGVRITGAPRDARVFADGYYVGLVDDFDGIFQHMNLEAGPHHIEIEFDGYAPIAFDVNVRPGETITFRADSGYFDRY